MSAPIFTRYSIIATSIAFWGLFWSTAPRTICPTLKKTSTMTVPRTPAMSPGVPPMTAPISVPRIPTASVTTPARRRTRVSMVGTMRRYRKGFRTPK